MIHIVADSSCDLPLHEQKDMQVHLVPIAIQFGSQSYQDGVDITHEEFYTKLEQAETLPTTAAPAPALFEKVFEECLQKGGEVVCVTIGEAFSGTYQSAVIGAQDFAPGRVHIVDSRNGSAGAALLVRQAHRMRQEGMSAGDIAAALRSLAPKVHLYALLDTMKYLWRSGRVSRSVGLVSNMLHIRPVMRVRDGVIDAASMARGGKGGIQALKRLIAQYKPNLSSGVAFFHGNVAGRMENLIEELKPLLGDAPIFRSSFSGAVGTNTGPGIVGIAFIAQ